MGLFDLLGITKRVNETDISRKKEEIDSLYNEMVKIADKLTETVNKIKDLKEKLENASPEAKPEAETDIKNKSEVSNNNETESEETGDDGTQVNEDLVSDESAAAPAAPAAPAADAVTQPAVLQTTPLFGSDTVQATTLVGATNNNLPLPDNNITGQQPQTQQPQQYGQPSQMPQQQPQQQQQYGQPTQNKNLGYGLKSSDPLIQSNGGKKNSNTKSASALKRKRRTRRNKKVAAAAAAAAATASASAAEASAET
jgi:hypothetical protein